MSSALTPTPHTPSASWSEQLLRLHIDVWLVGLLAAVGCMGLAVLYSASGGSESEVFAQFQRLVLGFVVMITLAQVRQIRRSDRSSTSLADVALPLSAVPIASPADSLAGVAERYAVTVGYGRHVLTGPVHTLDIETGVGANRTKDQNDIYETAAIANPAGAAHSQLCWV